MQEYRDIDGNSGVTHFEVGPHSIDIKFKGGSVYRYDYAKPGQQHVQTMAQLAASGKDLATYVNQHVRKNFSQRFK